MTSHPEPEETLVIQTARKTIEVTRQVTPEKPVQVCSYCRCTIPASAWTHICPTKKPAEITVEMLEAIRESVRCWLETQTSARSVGGNAERELLRRIEDLVRRAQAAEAERAWGAAERALTATGYVSRGHALCTLRAAQARDKERGRT